MQDPVIIFRLIERGLTSLLFLAVIIFLLWIYRSELASHSASAEIGPLKIAMAVTLPITIALILLGYIYVTVSNPVSVIRRDLPSTTPESDDKQQSFVAQERSIFLFNRDAISESFTNLANRDGGVDPPSIVRAQAILRTAIDIEELRKAGKMDEVEQLLSRHSLDLSGFQKEIQQLKEETRP